MSGLDIEITIGDIRPIPIPVTTVSVLAIDSLCWLTGWSFRETTGAAAAAVELRSGGNVIGEAAIPSGGTATQWLGPNGVRCEGGVTVHIVSGSVIGAVYAGYAVAC